MNRLYSGASMDRTREKAKDGETEKDRFLLSDERPFGFCPKTVSPPQSICKARLPRSVKVPKTKERPSRKRSSDVLHSMFGVHLLYI